MKYVTLTRVYIERRHPTMPDRQRTNSSAVKRALLTFGSLSKKEQDYFISEMNIFLTASATDQKRLVAKWNSIGSRGQSKI
jgi:hypothetical protein